MTQDLKKKRRARKKIPLPLALAAALVLVSLSLFFLLREEPQASDNVSAVHRLSEWTGARLTEVCLPGDGNSFTVLARADGGYAVRENSSLVISQEKGNDLFSRLTALQLTPLASSLDETALGFDCINETVLVTGSAGKAKLRLGTLLPSGTGRYVQLDDQTYTAPLFLSGIPSLQELHAIPTLYTTGDMPDDFLIVHEDGSRLAGGVKNDRSVGVTSLALTEPFSWEMDIEQAAGFINALSAIEITGWYAPATAENLQKFGFDHSLRLEVTYGETSWALLFGASAENGERYLFMEGDESIFTVNEETIRFFEEVEASTLMNRFAGLVSLSAITHAAIQWADGSLVLDRLEQGDHTLYSVNGHPWDETFFKEFYQTLLTPKIDRILEAETSAEGLERRLELVYTIVDGTEESVVYWQYNRDFDLLERNGFCRFLVNRERVDQVIAVLKEAAGK